MTPEELQAVQWILAVILMLNGTLIGLVLVVAKMIDIDFLGLAGEALALGFGLASLASLLGLAFRSVKILFSAAAGQPLD